MRNGFKPLKIMVTTTLLTGILMLAGCTTLPRGEKSALPVSPWGGKYFYKYEPPETKEAGSVKVTLAIVNPFFGGGTKVDPLYSKIAEGLSKSIAIDLDKIIVAKGMTVTGPFESLDMMTYPDKKNANLSLTPEFFINVQSRDTTGWSEKDGWLVKSVEERVEAWVVLILREPLSSEKIWVKKIEIGEKIEQAEIYAEKVPVGSQPGVTVIPVPWLKYQPGAIVYDGRPDAVANAIKKIYPEIMNTAWKYLNTQEILILKEKAEEIRKLKRF